MLTVSCQNLFCKLFLRSGPKTPLRVWLDDTLSKGRFRAQSTIGRSTLNPLCNSGAAVWCLEAEQRLNNGKL
eukprot:4326040-Pleurochrysis_carterae.AAC.3